MANSVVNQVKVGSTTYDMKPYLGSATSGDAASATAWTSVDAIATSDSYDTVFNKVTKMVKNVRYLYSKLGTTDFSGISSTVSGALTTLNSGKSDTTHNHDTAYAAKSHSHSNYSLTTHTHSNYSTTGHTHSNYASSTHNHDSAYAAKSHSHSEYSTTGHTHSNYSTTGHTHSNYSTTGHTHSYIATSNIVTSQTNSTSKVPAASLVYSMNSTLSSLNDAINNYTVISDSNCFESVHGSIQLISATIYKFGNIIQIRKLSFKSTAYINTRANLLRCKLRVLDRYTGKTCGYWYGGDGGYTTSSSNGSFNFTTSKVYGDDQLSTYTSNYLYLYGWDIGGPRTTNMNFSSYEYPVFITLGSL